MLREQEVIASLDYEFLINLKVVIEAYFRADVFVSYLYCGYLYYLVMASRKNCDGFSTCAKCLWSRLDSQRILLSRYV